MLGSDSEVFRAVADATPPPVPMKLRGHRTDGRDLRQRRTCTRRCQAICSSMRHGSVVPSPMEESARFARGLGPFGSGGRHPEVAIAQVDDVVALASDFALLSNDVLVSVAVGAGQRIITVMTPDIHTPPQPLSSGRESPIVSPHRWIAHAQRLRALSKIITQLVALERVLFEQGLDMRIGCQRHDAIDCSICSDRVGFQSTAESGARLERPSQDAADIIVIDD